MFLKDFLDIVRGIKVGDGKWKPFQSGLLLCTQTALDMQIVYLEKYNFLYLLLGRFTQDALENLFSSLHNKKAVPDAREFKQALRLITLSQFQADVRRSNYSANDANYIIEYCKDIRNLEKKIRKINVSIQLMTDYVMNHYIRH